MQFVRTLLPNVPQLTWTSVVDILVVAALIYQFFMIVRGRRSAHILGGIGVVILLYVVAVTANMELLRSILATLAPYTAFALIVMFQSDLRRLLARMGRRRWFTFGSRLERRESVDEILLAIEQLSQHRTGALIVLERDIGLRTFTESGISLDAMLSRDLLLSIFQPGGAMHDGAAILQGNRVVAAACFLPLTMNPGLVSTLGTRHRAGIGITEETDCLALIVSEETGRISIAAFGDMEADVSLERLGERISEHMGHKRRGVPLRSTLPVSSQGKTA
jgi:diadenylate cyclase